MWDPATIVVDAADCLLPQALQPLNPPMDDLGRLVLYNGTQAGRSVAACALVERQTSGSGLTIPV